MAFSIEKFSSWFCFVYSTKENFEFDYEYTHQLSINTKRLMEIIDKLSEMYREELGPVIDEILDVQQYNNFYFYMTTILSKCIEMSATPTYLHFLLVCTFVRGIILQRFRRKKTCFTFVKITSQCLIAVYNRRYKNLFENGSDSKTFNSNCKSLNTLLSKRMTAKGRKTLSPFNQPELVTLMANLLDKDDEDLKLTNSELQMLNETLSFLPDEDYPSDDDESTSRYASDATFSYESDEAFSNEVSNESESDEAFSNEVSNESESDDVLSNAEISNESNGVLLKEANANETEPMEVSLGEETNTNKSNIILDVINKSESEIFLEVKTNANGISLKVKTKSESDLSFKLKTNTNVSDMLSIGNTITIESASKEIIEKEEINTNDFKREEMSVKEEINSNEYAPEEIIVKREINANVSIPEKIIVKEINTKSADKKMSVKKEINTNESISEKIYVKEEINSNESVSGKVFVKQEEINKNDSECNESSIIRDNSSYYYESDEISSNYSSESLSTNENDSDCRNRICKYCGWKCFEFVFYVTEVERESKL